MQVRHLQCPSDIQFLSKVGLRGSCPKPDLVFMLDLTYEMKWLQKRAEEGDLDSGGMLGVKRWVYQISHPLGCTDSGNPVSDDQRRPPHDGMG